MLAPLKKGDKRVALSVKMDQKGAYVNKLRQIRINSPHEALTLLKAGQHGLTTGATRLNPDSSRSHCLFTLRIARIVNDDQKVTNLCFCDLAGSDDKSLFQLRLVISDLHELQKNTNKVVSFRNSKLTQLMEPYLVGHSMTCIMIAVSNDPAIYHDTKRSLEFASSAKQIIKLDRHGKKLKNSANPVDVKKDEHKINDPYGVGTDFSDWTKQDVIDDLVYYMNCVRVRDQCILNMKIEWQKDEQEWNENKVSYEDRIDDLKDLLQSARACTNDLISAYMSTVRNQNVTSEIQNLRDAINALELKLAQGQ